MDTNYLCLGYSPAIKKGARFLAPPFIDSALFSFWLLTSFAEVLWGELLG